ncbi:hypothetical protein BDZ89DRAFT_1093773 [Hymenopellis radicata]|nr:hypothetical protein BDZ89DRAFT_1093773 [Hymenopellis radicata]
MLRTNRYQSCVDTHQLFTETDITFRLLKQFKTFAVTNRLRGSEEEIFVKNPPKDTPWCIVAWIMHECDEIRLDGTLQPESEVRSSYSHAQKMRAAMTYGFGRYIGLSSKMPWQESAASPDTYIGNPSVSEPVSSFMLGLGKRKVARGEVPTNLLRLYQFNTVAHSPDDTETNWAGPTTRLLAQAIYTIAFVCLLRIDEALKIQVHDIQLTNDMEIQPFYLYMFPSEMAHLCPVHALAAYLEHTRIDTGYLFRKIDKRDRSIIQKNEPMSSEVFLEIFRTNLLAYGTHSFRRGDICEWGGWNTEFTHLTIVKYLISWNDNAMLSCSEFFDLNRAPTTKCWICGRSCHCA